MNLPIVSLQYNGVTGEMHLAMMHKATKLKSFLERRIFQKLRCSFITPSPLAAVKQKVLSQLVPEVSEFSCGFCVG